MQRVAEHGARAATGTAGVAAAAPGRPGVYVAGRATATARCSSHARRAQFPARRRRRRRGCRHDRAPAPAERRAATPSATSPSPATSGGDRYRVRASIEPGTGELADRRRLAARRRQHAAPAVPDRAPRHARRARGIVAARALGRAARAAAAARRSSRPPPRSRRATCRGASSGRSRAPRSAASGSRSTRCSARSRRVRTREAPRRLRRFVADASHELRTPLAAVRAYAELFARGAADAPGRPRRAR